MKQVELKVNGHKWIKKHLNVFWSQVHEPFEANTYTIREIYVGNLKVGEGGKWFRPKNYEEFKKYVYEQLDRFRDVECPGVYISQERYLAGEVECRDYFLDIDFKSNEPEEVFKAVKFLNEKLEKVSVHILWSLSGNGVHGRLDMLPVIKLVPYEERKQFLDKLPDKYVKLTQFLQDYLHEKGYNIEFDFNIYKNRGLIRALYSPHETTNRVEIPIDFKWSLKTNIFLSVKPSFVKIVDRYLGWVNDPHALLFFIEKILNEDVKLNLELIQMKQKSCTKARKGVRPVVQKLIEEAKYRDLEHYERLIILFELINNGYSDEEILKIFENQSDFDPKKTLYFIQHARSRGYKPFKTETILKLCPHLRAVKQG